MVADAGAARGWALGWSERATFHRTPLRESRKAIIVILIVIVTVIVIVIAIAIVIVTVTVIVIVSPSGGAERQRRRRRGVRIVQGAWLHRRSQNDFCLCFKARDVQVRFTNEAPTNVDMTMPVASSPSPPPLSLARPRRPPPLLSPPSLRSWLAPHTRCM